MSYRKNEATLTLGSDPEILICKKNSVHGYLRGENLIEDDDDNPLQFGVDGSGMVCELRPEPTNCPIQLTNNIRNIFNYQFLNNPKFANYDYLAGSYQRGLTIGGHIHFGYDKHLISPWDATSILSQYLGIVTILIEDRDQGLARRRSGYGGMYDNRDDLSYGFEYRTPSSWMTSPYIACAVLSLAKVVMWEILNNKNFKPQKNADEDTFSQMKTRDAKSFFPKVWADIVKMKKYQEYKPYIDLLYYLIDNDFNWFPKGDMKSVWGLVSMGNYNKSKFTFNTIWARYKAAENITKTN